MIALTAKLIKNQVHVVHAVIDSITCKRSQKSLHGSSHWESYCFNHCVLPSQTLSPDTKHTVTSAIAHAWLLKVPNKSLHTKTGLFQRKFRDTDVHSSNSCNSDSVGAFVLPAAPRDTRLLWLQITRAPNAGCRRGEDRGTDAVGLPTSRGAGPAARPRPGTAGFGAGERALPGGGSVPGERLPSRGEGPSGPSSVGNGTRAGRGAAGRLTAATPQETGPRGRTPCRAARCFAVPRRAAVPSGSSRAPLGRAAPRPPPAAPVTAARSTLGEGASRSARRRRSPQARAGGGRGGGGAAPAALPGGRSGGRCRGRARRSGQRCPLPGSAGARRSPRPCPPTGKPSQHLYRPTRDHRPFKTFHDERTTRGGAGPGGARWRPRPPV